VFIFEWDSRPLLISGNDIFIVTHV
jgi:hypothetical protein